MKLFLSTVLISLMGFASFSQAYTVYDLGTLPDSFAPFATDENIPTWGVGNRLGDGATISYSFAESIDSCDSCFLLNNFMPEGYQDTISSAFGAWASVADLEFKQVGNQDGNIVFWGKKYDDPTILGFGGPSVQYFSNGIETTSYIQSGFVDFAQDKAWSLSDDGLSLYDVALHEIGHALGLNHSFDPSSVMVKTYTGTSSLQPDDIAGIQYLYGASVSPVPEPSTYLMFLLGLAMVAGYGRRAVIGQK